MRVSELTEGHTVKGYDVDLAGLRLKLLEMGGLVLEQVQSAVTALAKADEAAARAVLEREEEVNRYDLAIDDDSFGWPAWCRDKLVLTPGSAGISNSAVQTTIRRRLDEWQSLSG